MADKRIIELPTEQTTDSADFLAIDSTTKGARKIRVEDLPSGGGGNTDYVELTQAEYDALTEEEKMNGKLYFITDGQGGGSGGSGAVSYGTSVPTESTGSDGELYIQVDANQIIDIWINVNGDWLPFVVSGTPALTLVYSSRDRNTSDTKTYTTNKSCRLLVACININGEASDKTLQSNITTTGTVVETWYHDSGWADPNRNHTIRWSIIDVDAGDTVSMETQTNGNYTSQIRAVWEIENINLSRTITNKALSIQADGNLPVSNTYTPSVDGTYLIWAVKTSGAGTSFSTSDVSVSTTPSTELESNVFDASGDGLLSIAIVKNPTSLEATITSSGNYCSRGYGVLKL